MAPAPVVNGMEDKVACNHERLLGLFLLVNGGHVLILGFGTSAFFTGRWIIGVLMIGASVGFWMEKEWAVNAAFLGFALNIACFAGPLGVIGVQTMVSGTRALYWTEWSSIVMSGLSLIGIVYLLIVVLVRRSRKQARASP